MLTQGDAVGGEKEEEGEGGARRLEHAARDNVDSDGGKKYNLA